MENKKTKRHFIWLICLTLCASCTHYSTEQRIPIHSFPFLSKQKFAEIRINDKQYLALIDTGSAVSMLRKDILDKIANKNYLSDSEYISIKGNKYCTPNFMLPAVKIGKFCTAAIFQEEDENFWTDGSSIGTYSFIKSCKTYLMYQVYREAVVGIDLFQHFACIFDFPHSSIFLANTMPELIGNGSEFCIMPFEMGKAGVIITFKTDLGEKRLLLDSAATTSLMRLSNESETYCTSRLVINNTDLGNWTFLIMSMASEFDHIEGILGVDFFNKNIIGFDFENHTAYIQSPKLGSKERLTYWMKSYCGK